MTSFTTLIRSFDKSVANLLPRVRPEKAFRLLCWVIFGLVVANICSFLLPEGSFLSNMLDINREKNIPTAFSTLILLICAVLLRQIYLAKRSTLFSGYWRGLSIIFFGMGLDECLIIHEHISVFLDPLTHNRGAFYYSWVVLGLLFVLVFVASYAHFIVRLSTKTRRRFLIAGAVYLFGVLGMELISGYYISGHGLDNRPTLALLNGIEETAEMLGISLFIRALLMYLKAEIPVHSSRS